MISPRKNECVLVTGEIARQAEFYITRQAFYSYDNFSDGLNATSTARSDRNVRVRLSGVAFMLIRNCTRDQRALMRMRTRKRMRRRMRMRTRMRARPSYD